MASRTFPTPLGRAKKPSLAHATVRVPSLRLVIVFSIGVLILFRWAHLVQSMQVTSTSRQILLATAKLSRLERDNALLQEMVSLAESPSRLAERAALLGYAPGQPLFLPVDTLVGQTSPGAQSQAGAPYPASAPSANLTSISGLHGNAFSTWLDLASSP